MNKFATWNVNSANVRLPRILNFLARESPDALCLQETKCMDEKFPRESIEKLGYHCEIWGQKTYNGVAILSKSPLKDVTRGLGKEYDHQCRIITGTVNNYRISSVYVPNGQSVGSEKYEFKLAWLKQLVATIKLNEWTSEKLLVMGDYNIAPKDIDIHDPKAWKDKILCSAKERKALTELVGLGLEDLYRKFHKDKQFSWWDYRGRGFEQNLGLRIDFILASAEAGKNSVYCRIDHNERKGIQPSDHAPVIAEFSD